MQSHQMKRAAGNSAPTDPNFKQTVLLLHGDGTNGGQNNTFIDSSTNNFTITRNGNTTQGTFSPFSQPDGYWSNYFDGTGDYISVPDSADFTMGSGDFTIECWVYSTVNSASDQYILGQVPSTGAAASTSFQIYKKATTNVAECFVYIGGSKVATSTATISINQWTHIAMVRDGATMRLYVNGVQDGTNATLSTSSIVDSTGSFSVGRTGDYNGLYFNGYVSNVSVIKGTCLYPSGTSFTPSTTPLSRSRTSQSVLLCYSNGFFDSNTATTAKTVTPGGDAAVTALSPFAPTAAYVASTNGGSAYFDGTGDYLSIADNAALDMGSSNFTIEGWYYPVGNAAVSTGIVSKRANSSTVGGVLLYYGSTGLTPSLLVDTGGTWGINTASSIAFNGNAWNHFAIVRNGTAFNLYINGVSGVSATSSATIPDNASDFCIGSAGGSTFPISTCYMSNFRVVKGTAVYTGAFTPPTAPLTAITNTQLLCNFTNAAILDNTGKNDLETVGNAQISTSVVKYGTGSMYFDGTGDWLLIRDNADLKMGTGNFTIEFWVYLASGDIGSNRGLVAKGGASTGWLVSLNTTEKVVFTYTASTITSTGSITTNAWNHIAVVREGTGSNQTKIYIGGSNDGTGTVSTDFTQTESMYVGADRSAASPMKGYIDDLRITKGVARYTANFTVPARAFPDK